jgi:hypothetical protein
MHIHRTLVVIGATLGFVAFGLAQPADAQSATPDSAQIALQSAAVTPDGQLTFGATGFAPNESVKVTIEDDRGTVQASIDSATAREDGQISMVTIPLPGGLALGAHTLRVAGQTSDRVGRTAFQVQWQPPRVQLESYTGKPTRTFSFAGSGFVPGEQVDIFLGAQPTDALVTLAADARGDITGRDLAIPLTTPGDYTLAFVGRSSHTPVSVGFNIQGFHPWAILDNYYVAPRTGMGFAGEDFVPGEVVQVFLNTRLSQPVAQVTADDSGHFAARNVFELTEVTGQNQLIFVGEHSQTEVTATFAAATPPTSTSD